MLKWLMKSCFRRFIATLRPWAGCKKVLMWSTKSRLNASDSGNKLPLGLTGANIKTSLFIVNLLISLGKRRLAKSSQGDWTRWYYPSLFRPSIRVGNGQKVNASTNNWTFYLLALFLALFYTLFSTFLHLI